MKHIFFFLSFTLLFTPLSRAAFVDVPTTHEFSDAISYVQTAGIVSGYADGTYKPDHEINRAEFLKIVVGTRFSQASIQACLQGSAQQESIVYGLSDVQTTAWYAPYVCLAKTQEIIKGYPDGTMKPAQSISFVEAAKIIAVSSGLPAEIHSADGIWYKPYVRFLEELKAIPTSIKTFDKKITRGEMAEMMYRQKNSIKSKPSMSYDALVIGNIVSGVEDCGDSVSSVVLKDRSGVLPYDQSSMDQSIRQYVRASETADEAHMSVYTSTSNNSLSGCAPNPLDPIPEMLSTFLKNGNGPIPDVPNYVGDIISAFGYYGSEALKVASIENSAYPGTDKVYAFYSLEGQDLPGMIHLRVVAQKDNSFILLSKNLENKITDHTKYFGYPALLECGGFEKPDRACMLEKIAAHLALKTHVEFEANALIEAFAIE